MQVCIVHDNTPFHGNITIIINQMLIFTSWFIIDAVTLIDDCVWVNVEYMPWCAITKLQWMSGPLVRIFWWNTIISFLSLFSVKLFSWNITAQSYQIPIVSSVLYLSTGQNAKLHWPTSIKLPFWNPKALTAWNKYSGTNEELQSRKQVLLILRLVTLQLNAPATFVVEQWLNLVWYFLRFLELIKIQQHLQKCYSIQRMHMRRWWLECMKCWIVFGGKLSIRDNIPPVFIPLMSLICPLQQNLDQSSPWEVWNNISILREWCPSQPKTKTMPIRGLDVGICFISGIPCSMTHHHSY